MNIWDKAVITFQGLALQAKLIAGNTLHITKIVIGSGYVSPDLLRLQTDVTDPQKTLTQVNSITYPETGKCAIKIRIDNKDVETEYTARQVGFYAMDPDLGEILYFIAQAREDTGTTVPANTDMYMYTAEWTFYFQYGQADNVTVVVDPANCVSRAEMESYVNQMLGNLKGYISVTEKDAANGVATLDETARLTQSQIPDIDCGIWDDDPVAEHNVDPAAHYTVVVDGNNNAVMDNSQSLEEHLTAPLAHQNLILDGNNAEGVETEDTLEEHIANPYAHQNMNLDGNID